MRAVGAGQLQDDRDEDGGAGAPERAPPGGTAHGFPKTPGGSEKSYAVWRESGQGPARAWRRAMNLFRQAEDASTRLPEAGSRA